MVGNAIKYGYSSTSIEFGYNVLEGGLVGVWVKNKGEILSTEELESILIPFARLNEKDQKQQGWGIGLSLVNTVIAAHGGSVTVTSQEGEGTCFFMAMPIDGPQASQVFISDNNSLTT